VLRVRAMTYAPNQPRMFADYAAVPTRRERTGARRYWQAAQADMFAESIEHEHQADEPAPPCPVCASTEHDADACPHGTAPALFTTDPDPEETTTMPDGPLPGPLPGPRDENRLTPADMATMAAAVETFARQTPTMGTAERYTTAERIAHRAIGCDERDLRDSELLAVRQMFKPVLAAHNAGKVTR
jgi:hypothetical protein